MKNSILAGLFLAVTWLAAATPAMGQEKLDQSIVTDLNRHGKMALGVTTERFVKGAIKVFHQMEQSGVEIEHFEVVIWGKVVEELVRGTELADFITNNPHPKLSITVCEVALDNMGVSASDLAPGIVPVPNGFTRMLQLQATGYNALAL